MNKQDLKAALSKIQPREALIEETLKKANELRYKETVKRPAFAFEGFNFKLAGAVCAFALVLSLGIFAGVNGFFTEEKNPPIEEVSFRHLEEITEAQQKSELSSEKASVMVEEAKKENAHWAVIEGVISGCYPSNTSSENKIRYLVQIDDVSLYDFESDSLTATAFENGLVAAFDAESGDEKFNYLINLMSAPIYIRLEADNTNEETSWKIIDFAN